MIDNPRVDLAIADHGRAIVIVLAAIGVLALVGAGLVAATPGTSTTTEEIDRETVTTEVTPSATVTEDGPWEAGTELEDSPVYTLPEAPDLTLTAETTVPNDRTEVDHEVRIRHEADRDEAVFWEETARQDRTAATVEDGVARSETTVDIAGLHEERAEIEAEFDGVGTVRTVLEVVAVYDTGTYTDEQVASSSLELTEDAYWLEEELTASTDHSETAQVEVRESPNVAAVAGLAALGVLSLTGAGFVRTRKPVDAEAARRNLHRHRYAEWISEGSIPMWVGDYHVELDTLEDVVDVAIDTNARVVHDRQRGLFAVVNDNVVYYHSERGQWEKTAWPELELGEATPSPSSPEEETLPAEESFGELPDPDDDDAWERI